MYKKLENPTLPRRTGKNMKSVSNKIKANFRRFVFLDFSVALFFIILGFPFIGYFAY